MRRPAAAAASRWRQQLPRLAHAARRRQQLPHLRPRTLPEASRRRRSPRPQPKPRMQLRQWRRRFRLRGLQCQWRQSRRRRHLRRKRLRRRRRRRDQRLDWGHRRPRKRRRSLGPGAGTDPAELAAPDPPRSGCGDVWPPATGPDWAASGWPTGGDEREGMAPCHSLKSASYHSDVAGSTSGGV